MRIAAQFTGTCSWFGGKDDSGVSSSEDLAWWETWDDVVEDGGEFLFLPEQPANTTGLARRLNADEVNYVACRWDYDETSKATLSSRKNFCIVYAPATDRAALAHPADWGPHEEKTGRAADLSPALMEALGIETDDTVVVIYLVTQE